MATFISAIIAANIAANNSRQLREEEKEEKRRKQEELCTNLLLMRGESENMEIGVTEKVRSTNIICNINCGKSDWFVYIEEEKIRMENFEACLQEIIKRYNPLRFQIIPYAIDKQYCIVDAYRVVFVVNESQQKKGSEYVNERCFK